MEINVEKLTDVNLLQRANSFTTGHESHMSLAKAYRYGHSPIRTQMFWIEMRDIPLFCASQFVRSHVGVQWFQRSKRTDRGGEDFREECKEGIEKINLANEMIECSYTDDPPYTEIREAMDYAKECFETFPNRFDRYAPTDLACLINAEAIINMSHKRRCMKASKETRKIWEQVLEHVKEVDPDLAKFCVKPCVHKGFCSEPKPCGWCGGKWYGHEREEYLKLCE